MNLRVDLNLERIPMNETCLKKSRRFRRTALSATLIIGALVAYGVTTYREPLALCVRSIFFDSRDVIDHLIYDGIATVPEEPVEIIDEGSPVNFWIFARIKNSAFLASTAEKYYSGVWRAENWFSDAETLALCEAMRTRNIGEIERLIAAGADVNARGKDNMRLLFWGVLLGDDILEVLLRNGADPNFIIESDYATDTESLTPAIVDRPFLFYMSSIAGITDGDFFNRIVSVLLKYGADPNFGNWCVLDFCLPYRMMLGDGSYDGDSIALAYGADPRRRRGGVSYSRPL